MNLVALGEQGGGVSGYARGLIGGLLTVRPDLRVELFTARDAPAWLADEPWAGDVAVTRLPVRVGTPPWHIPAQLVALPAVALRRKLDVVHGVVSVAPVRIPRLPSVATIHDLIWLELPDQVQMPGRLRATWRMLTGLSARHADRVLTGSEAAREQVVRAFGVDRRRIDVTPYAVPAAPAVEPTPEARLRATLALGDARVLLYPAQKLPYKNHAVLLEALPDLPPDVVLVLPGAPTPYEANLRSRARSVGVADRVRFPGWVSEGDLLGLYRLAAGVVIPSLMEGFGIPVLEAMREGVPVACSDRSALREVAGDAALLFDPTDARTVSAAAARLLADPALAAGLRRRGLARQAAFSWRRTAESTLDAYERVLAARRSEA